MPFQIGSALLDACVLGVLNQGSAYGYSLTQKIKTIAQVSESTLYPVLRRLLKENLLDTYDEAFDGRNRRYYIITESGKEKLLLYRSAWEAYKENIELLLNGGVASEQK